MQDHQTQSSSDEIDLSVVFDKIKFIFKSILIGIVQVFRFLWKHKFRLLIVLVIGVGLQILLISLTKKVYVNEFLIKTNFESTEYVYSKINSINAKLKSEDTVYLREIFGENYEKVLEVEVDPVVDVYNLVNKSEENREIFELLLEEYGDISFLEEEININEYPTHQIRIFIKGSAFGKEISNHLFGKLSSNPYYTDLKTTTLENYKEQLIQNKEIRSQIDSIIKGRNEIGIMPNLNDNAVSFTGSQNFRELLSQKKNLLYDDLSLRNKLSSENEVLKVIDSSYGMLSEDRNSSSILFPVALLGLYLFIYFIIFLSQAVLRFVRN
ncbi:hypothetical protein [Psychroflexus tropicus]|uniref:hypothetical protein n=1 Tax=Psychroflexus tropicus TaxID=197345 RepID=UPI00035FD237|nr:hypothetical protein [Psychroflexus tropicus]